jgi:hypothetical protein
MQQSHNQNSLLCQKGKVLNLTEKDYKAGLIEDRPLKRKRAYLQRHHSYCAPCKPLDLEHSVEGRGLL